MLRVQRGNVILDIENEDKQFYKDKGYDILGEHGEVIEKAIPSDAATLRKLYLETLAELEKYKTQVAELSKKTAKRKTTKE